MCWAASAPCQYLGAFGILTVSLSSSKELLLFLHLLNLFLYSLFLSPKFKQQQQQKKHIAKGIVNESCGFHTLVSRDGIEMFLNVSTKDHPGSTAGKKAVKTWGAWGRTVFIESLTPSSFSMQHPRGWRSRDKRAFHRMKG